MQKTKGKQKTKQKYQARGRLVGWLVGWLVSLPGLQTQNKTDPSLGDLMVKQQQDVSSEIERHTKRNLVWDFIVVTRKITKTKTG